MYTVSYGNTFEILPDEIKYEKWDQTKRAHIHETDVFENDVTNPTIIAEGNFYSELSEDTLIAKHQSLEDDSPSTQTTEVFLEGRDCRDIWIALNAVFSTYDSAIAKAEREWIGLCVCSHLYLATLEYRIGCIMCPKLLQKRRIRDAFTREKLRTEYVGYYYRVYNSGESNFFCDGCMKKSHFDVVHYGCRDCNEFGSPNLKLDFVFVPIQKSMNGIGVIQRVQRTQSSFKYG